MWSSAAAVLRGELRQREPFVHGLDVPPRTVVRALQARPLGVERLVLGLAGLSAQVEEEGDEAALDASVTPSSSQIPSRAASISGPSAFAEAGGTGERDPGDCDRA